MLENKTFDEIQINETATIKKELTEKDIELFASVSGDINPLHLDEEFAKTTIFKKRVAHGMWAGSLISTVIGTKLPGPGSIYLQQSLSFKRPVYIGDKLTIEVRVVDKEEKKKRIILQCVCTNQNNEEVLVGEAKVIAPTEKIKREAPILTDVETYKKGSKIHKLIDRALQIQKPFSMGVVFAVQPETLLAAVVAEEKKLITPLYLGPKEQIIQAGKVLNKEIKPSQIIDIHDPLEAAKKAVELVKANKIHSIMKGDLHSDELLKFAVAHDGIRESKRISHCLVVDVPTYAKLMIFTDVAVNINPDLETKKEILLNAIEFAKSIDISMPKVAILSAVETVLENIPSTLDAAALSKMAQRKQIKGAIVDGPLSFDAALSRNAALRKHLESEVTGDCDIFVVPNLDAGNIVIKQFDYLAHGQTAGIVIGAKVPIVLTSRAASTEEKYLSCALAKIFYFRKK